MCDEEGVTVVLRVVRSFPHRNIRPLVLKQIPLSLTAQQARDWRKSNLLSYLQCSVAWAIDRGCCFTNFLSPSIQVFLVDFYSPLKLDLNWTLQKIHLRQPEDRAPSRRGENLRPSDQERARRDIGAYQASWWFRRGGGEDYWGAGGALWDWALTLLLERLCRI